jgi:hypothetical protein
LPCHFPPWQAAGRPPEYCIDGSWQKIHLESFQVEDLQLVVLVTIREQSSVRIADELLAAQSYLGTKQLIARVCLPHAECAVSVHRRQPPPERADQYDATLWVLSPLIDVAAAPDMAARPRRSPFRSGA